MSLIRHLQIDYENLHEDFRFGKYEIWQADRFNQSMDGCVEFYIRLLYDDYCNMIFINAINENCKYFMNMRERVYNAGGIQHVYN